MPPEAARAARALSRASSSASSSAGRAGRWRRRPTTNPNTRPSSSSTTGSRSRAPRAAARTGARRPRPRGRARRRRSTGRRPCPRPARPRPRPAGASARRSRRRRTARPRPRRSGRDARAGRSSFSVIARTFRVRTTRISSASSSTFTWCPAVPFGCPSASASSVVEAARSRRRLEDAAPRRVRDRAQLLLRSDLEHVLERIVGNGRTFDDRRTLARAVGFRQMPARSTSWCVAARSSRPGTESMRSRGATARSSSRRATRRLVSFLRSSSKPIQALPLVRARDDLDRPRARDRVRLAPGGAGAARRRPPAPRRRARRASGSSSAGSRRAGRPTRSTTTARASTPGCSRSAAPTAGAPRATATGRTASSARWPRRTRRPPAVDEDSMPTAVDGCGVVTFALSLERTAGAFSPARRASAAASGSWSAMRAHPELVGGAGQADTELMRALPGWIAKGGAEGLMCAADAGGLGVALKVEDGSQPPDAARAARVLWPARPGAPRRVRPRAGPKRARRGRRRSCVRDVRKPLVIREEAV